VPARRPAPRASAPAAERLQTKRLPTRPDAVAPDGSDVRILLGLARGGMAHFELGAGQTSVAVVHHTVEELWYFLRGRGEMWRRLGDREEVVEVRPGVCISIPVGTEFQFRAADGEPLAAVAATMPPWPGEGEAALVEGPWEPTVEPGPA
jgi:mannose-6-phosphate isomerase-like protein (cupin superfamily)